jgi:hypothetical protein
MTTAEHKDFAKADEVREFTNGQVELLHIGGSDIGRLVLQPGWRWSEHVKPLAGTELCEAPHFQYHVAGTLRIQMADGTEFDAVPGQVTALPSGHDAWVVGDEPVVVVDWWGASKGVTALGKRNRLTGPISRPVSLLLRLARRRTWKKARSMRPARSGGALCWGPCPGR